jgi:hypothetical protein
MKRLVFITAFAALSLLPTKSHAYFGVDLGIIDESNFGYGLSFGASLPYNLGIDVQLLGFYKNVGPTGNLKTAWIQGNADLFYDFNWLVKDLLPIDLHPYGKAGFSYLANGFYDSTLSGGGAYTKGPGFNIGGGVDWKLMELVTVGVDFTETIASVSGEFIAAGPTGPITGSGSGTAKVFNVMGVVKFFAY